MEAGDCLRVFILLSVIDPLVTITERNFDLARNLAVLAGNDQFDLSELILGQTVIENFKHAIDAAIEFPFVGFGVVGTVHTILHGEASTFRCNLLWRFSGFLAILELLLEHFPDFVDIVPQASKDPYGRKVKEYARTIQDCIKDWVVASEFR